MLSQILKKKLSKFNCEISYHCPC